MRKGIQYIFPRLKSQPKQIFLLDGIGAFLSTLFLLFIAKFHEVFGMPYLTVCLLCTIALVLCIYSLCCSYFVASKWRPFLLVIIAANVLYSLLTGFLVVYHFRGLTALGLAYFVAELVVLGMVVALEVNVLTRKQD